MNRKCSLIVAVMFIIECIREAFSVPTLKRRSRMAASQELKDILVAEFQVASKAALESVIDSAYDSGFNNAPGGEPSGGITQEQLDAALLAQKDSLKAAVVALIDAHDADSEVDQVLKDRVLAL